MLKGFGALVDLDRAVQATRQIDPPGDTGSMLTGAAILGVPGNGTTAAFARLVLERQRADGSWNTIDNRPPQSYSTIGATAYALRAVRAYAAAGSTEWGSKAEASVARARDWIARAPIGDTADLVYRVQGLLWAGAGAQDLAPAVDALRGTERRDGGWGQLPRLASDAYSTATALAALEQAGAAPAEEAVDRGLRWLMDAQLPDGSWHVRSRVTEQDLVSPPYFETGFPHGPDQMISAMATAAAVTAIAGALPSTTDGKSLLAAGTWHADEPAWVRTVQQGTVGDLARALDGGLSANAATAGGTSVLMVAAPDLPKMRLLLDRGADPARAAASGVTPLMVAANWSRSANAVRLLLARGAPAVTPAPAVNEATAAGYAIWSGDTASLRALLAAGARVPSHIALAGGLSYASPLDIAVIQRDEPMIRALVAAGQDVNALDESGLSLLTQAALMNDAALVRLLVSLGADVNRTDESGATPLMHAAQMDYGETGVVEALLAAGASRAARDKDGRTALDLATHLEYPAIVAGLAPAPASR